MCLDERSRGCCGYPPPSATAGTLRGIMSAANLRGPFASLMHTNVRLTFGQVLENATGVGAPPWTWPRDAPRPDRCPSEGLRLRHRKDAVDEPAEAKRND